jgi:outer membrane protein insertion porin family
MKKILSFLIIFSSFLAQGQNDPTSLGGIDFSYQNPKQYEIGPIRVEGAENFDHQAIKLIAGLRQGQKITLPGEQINKAIKSLWAEGLFSNISI